MSAMENKSGHERKSLESVEKAFLEEEEDYRFYNEDDSKFRFVNLHEHNFYELFFYLSGSVDYVIEQGVFPLKEFDLVIVPPHCLHQLTVHDENAPYKRNVLWIYPKYVRKMSSPKTDLLARVEEFNKNGHYIIRDLDFAFEFKKLVERISAIERDAGFGQDLLYENAFREIFVLINRYLEAHASASFSPNGNPAILSAIQYIEQHIAEKIAIKDLSDHVGLNEYYLSHLFKKEVGSTVHRYINKKRLNTAKGYLDERMPLKEIATRTGFGDVSHFIQVFKKEYGVTPKKYMGLLGKMK